MVESDWTDIITSAILVENKQLHEDIVASWQPGRSASRNCMFSSHYSLRKETRWAQESGREQCEYMMSAAKFLFNLQNDPFRPQHRKVPTARVIYLYMFEKVYCFVGMGMLLHFPGCVHLGISRPNKTFKTSISNNQNKKQGAYHS